MEEKHLPQSPAVNSERLSGVELLRTLSIFLILVIHVINLVIGVPSIHDLKLDAIPSITIISLESLSIVCVDVFIIISGWFGIRSTNKGLAKLIFQCVFFTAIEFVIGYIAVPQYINSTHLIKQILTSFFPGWFISAYIMLYILSPLINNYIETHNSREIQKVLIPVWGFTLIYGWLLSTTSGNKSTFVSGYSALFLFILYFTVRYLKAFYFTDNGIGCFKSRSNVFWLKGYFIATTINVFLWITFTLLNFQYYSSILFLYTSPIVIFQSFCLFRYFHNLTVKSTFINKIGASSLSIMLLHFCCGGIIFKGVINHIYLNYDGILCLLLIFSFLICISIIAITLDRIRLFIWNKIEIRFYTLSKHDPFYNCPHI